MSLIWMPANAGKRNSLPINNTYLMSFIDMVDGMRQLNYQPICCLEFETKSWQFLEQVKVHNPSTNEFTDLATSS
ncbi:MAG: hypothetical protein IPJ82_13185 [Lewinellaceae bacterium]|nr:hypothetical protein [Lewinellaceae bacterium]